MSNSCEINFMKRARDEQSNNEFFTDLSTPSKSFPCPFINCNQKNIKFSSQDEYEAHILGYHYHLCNECKRRFPSDAYLQVHIEENHDPFFQIKKEQGQKVYRCLEYSSGCKKMCIDRQKRRLHMIDKHGYPRDFQFRVIDHGIS